MVTYAFNPRWGKLAENSWYVLPCALVLLTGTIAANYVGMRVAKWVDNFGGIGAYLVAVILVVSAIAALVSSGSSKGSATQFHLAPSWDLDKLNFWSQLAM